MDKRVKKFRICLSFRCFIPVAARTPPPQQDNHGSSVDTSLLSPVVPTSDQIVDKEVSPKKLDFTLTPPPQPPVGKVPPLSSVCDGYSPFNDQDISKSNISDSHQASFLSNNKSERICLIIGSSITSRIDGEMMSRGSRTVLNLSHSGARIPDARRVAEDFYVENPHSVGSVDKVIVRRNTNPPEVVLGR